MVPSLLQAGMQTSVSCRDSQRKSRDRQLDVLGGSSGNCLSKHPMGGLPRFGM
jgi:hypothetical protein